MWQCSFRFRVCIYPVNLILFQQEVGTIYTHHQKTVILDADAGNGKRKIIAFVGGLDLCSGRYDNPQHPLFRSLNTFHKDDYHNPTFTVIKLGCNFYWCCIVYNHMRFLSLILYFWGSIWTKNTDRVIVYFKCIVCNIGMDN